VTTLNDAFADAGRWTDGDRADEDIVRAIVSMAAP
jgi:hypothetical protein